VGGTAAVAHHAGTKSAQAQAQEDAQNQQIADLQQQQVAAAPPPPAPAAPTGGALSADAMAQLKQLGELHEQGVLSDTEFTAAKDKILGI